MNSGAAFAAGRVGGEARVACCSHMFGDRPEAS